MSRVRLVAASVGVALLLAGCAGLRGYRARKRVPRVVLVTLDTLHVNRVGPYNAEVETTPFLDRFAEEGVRFAYAYTHAPITLPSHASLMTGVSPPSLGVMANGDRVPDEAETLAEILRRRRLPHGCVHLPGRAPGALRAGAGVRRVPRPLRDGPDSMVPARARDLRARRRVANEAPGGAVLPVGALLGSPRALRDAGLGAGRRALRRRRASTAATSWRAPSTTASLSSSRPGEHRLEWRSLWETREDDRPDTGPELTMLTVNGLGGADAGNLVRRAASRSRPPTTHDLVNPGLTRRGR